MTPLNCIIANSELVRRSLQGSFKDTDLIIRIEQSA